MVNVKNMIGEGEIVFEDREKGAKIVKYEVKLTSKEFVDKELISKLTQIVRSSRIIYIPIPIVQDEIDRMLKYIPQPLKAIIEISKGLGKKIESGVIRIFKKDKPLEEIIDEDIVKVISQEMERIRNFKNCEIYYKVCSTDEVISEEEFHKRFILGEISGNDISECRKIRREYGKVTVFYPNLEDFDTRSFYQGLFGSEGVYLARDFRRLSKNEKKLRNYGEILRKLLH